MEEVILFELPPSCQLPADTTQAKETALNSTTTIDVQTLSRSRRHESICFESEMGGDDSDSDSS